MNKYCECDLKIKLQMGKIICPICNLRRKPPKDENKESDLNVWERLEKAADLYKEK